MFEEDRYLLVSRSSASGWSMSGFSDVVIAVGLTMFLPMAIHMIPSWDDSPIGGKLIPIFYAPLIAALTRRIHVSVIASVVSPWLNYLIFGQPSLFLAMAFSLQLIPFCWVVYLFSVRYDCRFLMGPLAYLVCKPIVLIVFLLFPRIAPEANAISYLFISTWNSAPGVIILGIIGYCVDAIFPPDLTA